jgi:hypothetical protein
MPSEHISEKQDDPSQGSEDRRRESEPRVRLVRESITPSMAFRALETAVTRAVPRTEPEAEALLRRREGVTDRTWMIYCALAALFDTIDGRPACERLTDEQFSFFCLAALPTSFASTKESTPSNEAHDGDHVESAWERMDALEGPRRGDLLLAYYLAASADDPPTYDDLAKQAGQTRENIHYYISRGIKSLHNLLPEELTLSDGSLVKTRRAFASDLFTSAGRNRQGQAQTKILKARWQTQREEMEKVQAAGTAAAAHSSRRGPA